MSRYDELLTPGGQAVLRQIYPSEPIGGCPGAADALHDYLGGQDAREVSPYSVENYSITATWQRAGLSQLSEVVRRMGRDHHVVVRGTRGAASSMTRTHFFLLANIGGRVYVLDASLHEVNGNPQEYIGRQEFQFLDYSTEYNATAQLEP
ncbi:MAG TPA: hypothetical protein PLX20_06850 [Rhodocyclaceae bacterium]|mgnify:FL=1|nr:hypothetical protein [Rhodocyclaceae bacterium]HMV55048.1 hypothetical protein [Rhodocyclaceae bacterium]HMZ83980.1 hypothetical protein [Rhodocyclaceae bacterium]HNA02632.1 hypothetical protein [Rhodocyclaceae bacterium]HNB77101.1 hypothetical protein [Rhodocyclaceae bacterium]